MLHLKLNHWHLQHTYRSDLIFIKSAFFNEFNLWCPVNTGVWLPCVQQAVEQTVL